MVWSCLGFPFAIVPGSIFLAWNLTASSPSKTTCVALFRVSQRIGSLRLMKRVFVDASMLLLCYYAFVLKILEYWSPVWGLLLNVIFSFSSARCIRGPGFALIRVSCRCVIDVMLLHCVLCRRLIRTLIIVYSVSFHLLLSVRHSRAAASAHPLDELTTSQFARCFLPAQPRVWNDLPYNVFDTGTLNGFKEAVNRLFFPLLCFSVFRGAGAFGVAKAIYTQFCLSRLRLCCKF